MYLNTEHTVNLLVIFVGVFTNVLCQNEKKKSGISTFFFFKRELKVAVCGSCEFVREPECCCLFYVLFLMIDYVADLKA